MIQLKATCLRCLGTGYQHNTAGPGGRKTCPDCDGAGTIVLTSENWDIALERVPPFSLEEMEEMRGK